MLRDEGGEPVDLEGRLVAFWFGEQDSEDEYWGYRIFRVEGERLRRFYEPFGMWDVIDPGSNARALERLRKEGADEVYTVFFRGEPFMGIPADWEPVIDPPPGEDVEHWLEYKPLYADTSERAYLEDNGVRVRSVFRD